jgi:hypothetical protein
MFWRDSPAEANVDFPETKNDSGAVLIEAGKT